MIRALAFAFGALLLTGASPRSADGVCGACVRAHVERLAAPDLHGRRCGTPDEAAAATYLEGELKAAGVAGAWPDGGFRQTVPLKAGSRPGRLAVAEAGATATAQSVNLVGVVHGSDRDADAHALLLSAHYDHLGERDGKLYPGANDDASGTAAVLELARVLAHGPKPKRTVYVALFSCEEAGELGSEWFGAHPVTPIANLAVNLEFEMIGFPDPKRPDRLMMTGYERSDLGDAMFAHGAMIGPDLYPEGRFFERSDNFQLARQGVVAHTFSGWPTPPTYHNPEDDPAHVDFAFMAATIQSLVAPVRWLADGGFTPTWRPGGRP